MRQASRLSWTPPSPGWQQRRQRPRSYLLALQRRRLRWRFETRHTWTENNLMNKISVLRSVMRYSIILGGPREIFQVCNQQHIPIPMQELQAKLASQQEAGARKDAELEAVHRHREELEAMLAEADRAPEAGRQHSDFGRPEPALLLPAPSGSQVCWLPSLALADARCFGFWKQFCLTVFVWSQEALWQYRSIFEWKPSSWSNATLIAYPCRYKAWGRNAFSSSQMSLQGQELTMSASEAGELRAAAAEKTALLAAAEERLARLEALHRIAQVLHSAITS